LDEFSATWPRWGMMQDGVCWALPTLAPRTSGSVSGLWLPTPLASDANSGRLCRHDRFYQNQTGSLCRITRNGKRWTVGLGRLVQLWPTPTASDATKWNNMTAGERLAKGQMVRLGNSLSTTENRVGGKLNPRWVEWLMGWPIGHTDLKPLATDKSLYVPPPPGKSSQTTFNF
jgi:hypothetical protein